MWNAFKKSFRVQLISTMVGILLIPIVFGCIFTYQYFAQNHEKQTNIELQWLSKNKKAALENFVHSHINYLRILQNHPEIRRMVLQNNALSSTQLSFLRRISSSLPENAFTNFIVIDAGTESVLFKSKTESTMNSNFLHQIVQQTVQKKNVFVSNIEFDPITNEAHFVISLPVLNSRREVVGLVALQISHQAFNQILTQNMNYKSHLQVYLIDQNGHVLSAVSRVPQNASVKFSQFENLSACKKIVDFNEQEAYACASPLKFGSSIATGADWYVIAQIPQATYTTPLKNLIIFFIILCSFLLLFGGLVAFFMGNRVTKPIVQLINSIKEISSGNLAIDVPVLNSEHEIARLTYGIKEFVEKLKTQIHDLIESINTISTSSSEVSATVAQITASSSETASAITETASSAEEVSQLANTFNEKSKESIKVGEIAAEISNQGTEAFNKINQGIQEVKNQMDQVAGMVIDLSKQSQTISEITDAVKEIAEQSNILAINASIEATKAGEYGRGFAVVANEVRNLADQSKKSTLQIQNILDTIQESVSKTVLQVEQTNKTIDQSVNFVQTAYDSMTKLSHSIDSLITVLSEISNFAQEQLTGTSQIKEAMENIKEATSQNLDGMRQLEDVIDDLKKTSENLKMLISEYRLN